MSKYKPWPKATPLKPGEFKAQCRMGQTVLFRDMTSTQVEAAEEAGWARTTGYTRGPRPQAVPAFVRPDCEGLEFADPALFEQHVTKVHGRRKAGNKTMRPRWSSPRLTEEGRPFEPIGLEPGAEITWTELIGAGPNSNGERVTRTGQVWSAAERGTAWVVPHEPLEGELCVRLELTKYGDVLVRETRMRKAKAVV